MDDQERTGIDATDEGEMETGVPEDEAPSDGPAEESDVEAHVARQPPTNY